MILGGSHALLTSPTHWISRKTVGTCESNMSKTKGAESVKVVVRCRPLNEKEIAANHERVVDMDIKSGQVHIRNPKG